MKHSAFTILVLLLLHAPFRAQCQAPAGDLANQVAQGIDPYFVESKDTVSRHAPACITRAILHDKAGHTWFATWQGIIEYNGKTFTNHTLKDHLIHFHIVSLFENRSGALWFGTARGGLYRYNGAKFTLFTKKDGLPDSTIVCMAEDDKGNIWFGTEEGGASYYDGKNFRNLTVKDGLSGNHVNTIAKDKKGNLWIGTTKSVDIYNGKTVSHLLREGRAINQVSSLLWDSMGTLWIGRYDGLTLYDGHHFTDLLSPHLTYYIAEDSKGNTWLAHSEPNKRHPGLPKQVLYRYDGKSFTKIIEKDSPNDFQVFGNVTDTEGNTWFGTMHGPCMYDGKRISYFTK